MYLSSSANSFPLSGPNVVADYIVSGNEICSIVDMSDISSAFPFEQFSFNVLKNRMTALARWGYVVGTIDNDSGNVFTAGMFSGTVDFNPSAAVVNLSGPTFGDDGFISKLDASGNFVWVKQLEGTIRDVASLALDTAGNVYTTKNFLPKWSIQREK